MTRLSPPPDTSLDSYESSLTAARRSHPLDGNAFRGLKRGVRGYSRFSALIFFGAMVIAAAAVLRCELAEWCLLFSAVGLVLTTELCHGAVQALARSFHETDQPYGRAAVDLASAAGFVATVVAALIAAAVFLNRLSAFPGN